MKNFRNSILVAAVAILGFTASASAQKSASASAGAEARIVAGISLEKTADLKFGSIVKTAEGGVVTISATSGEINYEGVTRGQNTEHQAASFHATGEPEYRYMISLPKEVTITRQGGKETMTITKMDYSEKAGTLSKDGTESFNVGGSLRVNPNQATGQYNGTFDVAVQYE